MSDLQEAVETRLRAFTPPRVPHFDAVQARHRQHVRRRRLRAGAAAAILATAVVTGARGLSAGQQEQLTPATRPAGTTATPDSASTRTPASAFPPVPYDASSAPAAFTEREKLASCGSYALPQPLVPQDLLPAGAVACLQAAQQNGRGAELAVSRLSVEGEPTITYYRVLPDGRGAEQFVDTTHDGFSTPTWQRTRCTNLAPDRLVLLDCQESQRL